MLTSNTCTDIRGSAEHLSPIALFVYARLDHTKRTIEALRKNFFAFDSDLIVFSDAAPNAEMEVTVEKVRAYISDIQGFRSVSVYLRSRNFGLAKSIIDGVTQVLLDYDRVIVMEDDLVTSPYFLKYMNESLERYADDERVISVHGYVYPVKQPLPEAFFLPGADCWGWATWRRGWACFNPDGQYLLNELKRRKMIRTFNLDGSYPYSEMLQGQINGTNDSWAIRWRASAYLAGKLTLHPGRSLVQNIGNDDSGTHCSSTSEYDTILSETPIKLDGILVKTSMVWLKVNKQFHRQLRSPFMRLLDKYLPDKIKKLIKILKRIFVI